MILTLYLYNLGNRYRALWDALGYFNPFLDILKFLLKNVIRSSLSLSLSLRGARSHANCQGRPQFSSRQICFLPIKSSTMPVEGLPVTINSGRRNECPDQGKPSYVFQNQRQRQQHCCCTSFLNRSAK